MKVKKQLFLGRWKMLVIVLLVSGIGVVAVGIAEEKVLPADAEKKTPAVVATSNPEIKTQTFADIVFVWIEPGTFMMGSPDSEEGRQPIEGPQHQVTLTQGFWMGKYEVTQAQWESVMGNNPSQFRGSDLPVDRVSWNDAQALIAKLNSLGKGTFRLPTEAEWEYACRAGSTTPYFFGDDAVRLDDYAWHSENDGGMIQDGYKTHPVGKKHPNAWGLYDMNGNLWEWCQDWCGGYTPDSMTDPVGPGTGKCRVLRGGSFNRDSEYSRSAYRDADMPDLRIFDIGLRIVRNP